MFCYSELSTFIAPRWIVLTMGVICFSSGEFYVYVYIVPGGGARFLRGGEIMGNLFMCVAGRLQWPGCGPVGARLGARLGPGRSRDSGPAVARLGARQGPGRGPAGARFGLASLLAWRPV